jgi:hypothetical protein
MDWSGSKPDPLVRELLISDRIEQVKTEAWIGFFNTLGVVMGPMHVGVQSQLDRARQWQQDLAGTSGASWAAELVSDFEKQVEFHIQRDAETDLDLR